MPNSTQPSRDHTPDLSDRHDLAVHRLDDTIWVIGEIDVATADQFGRALACTDEQDGITRLDLRGVDFFSAAGVRCLISAGWTRRPHPALAVSPAVRKVLDLCHLTDLLGCEQPGRLRPSSPEAIPA